MPSGCFCYPMTVKRVVIKEQVKSCGNPEKEARCPRGSREGCAEEVTMKLGFERGSVFDSREEEGQSRWGPQKDSYS